MNKANLQKRKATSAVYFGILVLVAELLISRFAPKNTATDFLTTIMLGAGLGSFGVGFLASRNGGYLSVLDEYRKKLNLERFRYGFVIATLISSLLVLSQVAREIPNPILFYGGFGGIFASVFSILFGKLFSTWKYGK